MGKYLIYLTLALSFASGVHAKDIKHTLSAISDFKPLNNQAVVYYPHHGRQALAINAGRTDYRNKFASASYKINKDQVGTYQLTLVTLAEIDGESNYQVKLNGKIIGEFVNPETDIDYKKVYFELKNVKLKEGDVLTVSSMAVTNGKIPENDETAYARGRWTSVLLGS